MSSPAPAASDELTPYRRGLWWLAGALALVIFMTALLTARSLGRLVDAQASVTQALAVDRVLNAVLVGMLDAETGQRGYLLSGRGTYLAPYYGALQKLQMARAELAAVLVDQPDAAPQLAALSRAIDAKLRELDRTVEMQTNGQHDEALALVLTDAGRKTMEAVRGAVAALADSEAQRAQQRKAVHADEIRNTYVVFAASIGLNLLLLGGLVWRMRKEARQAQRSNAAVRQRHHEVSRLLHLTAARSEQAQALSDLSRFLQSCTDIQEAVGLLRQRMPALTGASGGALYLFAASKNQLRCAFSWGASAHVELLEPEECWGLRRGQPFRQPPEGGAAACQHLHPQPPGHPAHAYRVATECLPMVAHGELMGLLVLEGPEPANAQELADEERSRQTVLEQVGLALGNLKLRESLRQQSIRDALTGLYNRRFLEESMQRELLRAQRLQLSHQEAGMAVLMVDVDHFKRFNDRFGHETGDLVLREVAQVLMRGLRGSDVAARYGGEEFTLVLPEVPLAQATQRAERLRADVEALAAQAVGRAVGAVTVSIGLAYSASPAATGANMEGLLAAADKALYEAKRAGRNRVALADPAEGLRISALAELDESAPPRRVAAEGARIASTSDADRRGP